MLILRRILIKNLFRGRRRHKLECSNVYGVKGTILGDDDVYTLQMQWENDGVFFIWGEM